MPETIKYKNLVDRKQVFNHHRADHKKLNPGLPKDKIITQIGEIVAGGIYFSYWAYDLAMVWTSLEGLERFGATPPDTGGNTTTFPAGTLELTNLKTGESLGTNLNDLIIGNPQG